MHLAEQSFEQEKGSHSSYALDSRSRPPQKHKDAMIPEYSYFECKEPGVLSSSFTMVDITPDA